MAVASLVLGICSIVICCVPVLGLAGGIVAIVLASRVFKQLKDGIVISGSKGMATAGLVLGIIGTIFSVLYNLVWLFIVLTNSKWPSLFNGMDNLFRY
jgi:hypothetical protein